MLVRWAQISFSRIILDSISPLFLVFSLSSAMKLSSGLSLRIGLQTPEEMKDKDREGRGRGKEILGDPGLRAQLPSAPERDAIQGLEALESKWILLPSHGPGGFAGTQLEVSHPQPPTIPCFHPPVLTTEQRAERLDRPEPTLCSLCVNSGDQGRGRRDHAKPCPDPFQD